jgi:hypothetical protein
MHVGHNIPTELTLEVISIYDKWPYPPVPVPPLPAVLRREDKAAQEAEAVGIRPQPQAPVAPVGVPHTMLREHPEDQRTPQALQGLDGGRGAGIKVLPRGGRT